MSRSLSLKEMKIISTIEKYQSLSLAGEKLNIAQSNISKYLSGVEDKLNVQLFERSSKSIKTTSQGQLILNKVNECLQEIFALDVLVSNINSSSNEFVSIYAPLISGVSIANSIIDSLSKTHGVKISISTYVPEENSFYDGCNYPESCDILLATSLPRDENLVAKKLFDISFRVYATPKFLEDNPIEKAMDLELHNCILNKAFTKKGSSLIRVENKKNRMTQIVNLRGDLLCDNVLVAIQLAQAHLGFFLSPEFQVREYLKSGIFKDCLSEHEYVAIPFYLITKPNRFRTKKMQITIETLADKINTLHNKILLELS